MPSNRMNELCPEMPYFKIAEFLSSIERKLFSTILHRSIFPVLREVELRRRIYSGENCGGINKPMEFWSDVQITHWHFRKVMLSHIPLEEKILKKYAVLTESKLPSSHKISPKPKMIAGRWSDIIRNTYSPALTFIPIEKRPPISFSFYERDTGGLEYEYLTVSGGDLISVDREHYIFETDKDPFVIALL